MEKEAINSVVNNIRESTESFMKMERQLHKAMCNPDTSKLQEAIDSKKEMDHLKRIKELELLNEGITKQLKSLNRRSTIKAIIIGVVSGIIVNFFMKYYPTICDWFATLIQSTPQ